MIDGGDFFGPKAPVRERDKSKLVSRIMGSAKYDVVGVGEAELRYGLGFLRAQLEASSLPAVSANLVFIDSGDPVFSPYLVLRRGGLRVGVTAITGELEPLRGREDVNAWRDQNITLADPQTSLAKVIGKMEEKEKADIVIVLSHIGDQAAEPLLQAVPGVDIWYEVHNRGRYLTPEKKEETIFASSRGRSSGYAELYLSLDETAAIGNFVGQGRTLPGKGPSDPIVAQMLADFKKSSVQQKAVAARPKASARRRFDTTKVNQHTFVGGESCKKCHAEVFESWSHTPHAAAYATIAETDQWNDPDCLLCHTTGYGEMSDLESGMIEPRFWNVQCESCHGRGTEHSRSAGAAEVAEADCVECHNQSNSPEFDYAEYRKHVMHEVH